MLNSSPPVLLFSSCTTSPQYCSTNACDGFASTPPTPLQQHMSARHQAREMRSTPISKLSRVFRSSDAGKPQLRDTMLAPPS